MSFSRVSYFLIVQEMVSREVLEILCDLLLFEREQVVNTLLIEALTVAEICLMFLNRSEILMRIFKSFSFKFSLLIR